MKKIAIIGAGITGITTAYQLIKRGYDVTVFEKHRYPGMETSFANGGQLSASNAEVWTSWNTVGQAIKWIFKKDAPLLFNPRPTLHKLTWVLEFLANIPNHKKNTLYTAKMAIESRKEFKKILKEENLKINLEEKGILHLSETKQTFEQALKINKWLNDAGLERYPVTINEIKKIEPTINLKNMFGGFFTKSDMTGDIHLFTKQLAEICKNKGVNFKYSSNVTKILYQKEEIKIYFNIDQHNEDQVYNAIVICAGVDSKKFASMVGDKINIYPVKGYSITVMLNDIQSQMSAPKVSLLDDKAKIVTSRLGKYRFRVAGTAEFNGFNKDIRDDRIIPLLDWCNKLFPKVSTEHSIPWAGLRPMTPSMMPKIGKGTFPGVFYNTGHGHLGWTLSSLSSEIIADQILSHYEKI